ncbi:hypothetical protein PC129_g7896 [Phytophthora cactorum]|uniref:Uncharacterized protein n=1 Tax=Phytophthora cactorum TaxID=29920 RepID=A0A8T1I9J3_9STRA|nr:hypothetical protein Pcac1_g8620 [Phytophthora cactorum]KAG2913971.1 hypothetical protein PC114_g8364 [Phytophthora cactorum]KAG2945732.1 hypothetical protein PC117_g8226 [Phytophthora cactorum]KAG3024890.1 hypothetical protein PC120_g6817 [Phytophthora cactorum]KAG3026958.1 hypothetical protein PC119_g7563 [Phytophthora cactorum]
MSNTVVIEWSTDMYLIWDIRLLAFESARLSQSLTDRQLKQNTMDLRLRCSLLREMVPELKDFKP